MYYLEAFKIRAYLERILILSFLICGGAFGGPARHEDYVVFEGGLVDVPEDSYVEGSSKFGGMQPDYHIDTASDEMKRVIDYGKRIGKSDMNIWDKIDRINKYIQKQFPGVDYDDPDYVKTSATYKESNQNVPLSKYLICGAGVCREHALVTHFVLKAAGIEAYHVYAKVHQSSNPGASDIFEDHAFNVVRHEGELWLVDPYNWNFNGYRLQDMMSKKGITDKSKRAPFAISSSDFRNIVEINSFPKIWAPKELAKDYAEKSVKIPNSCSKLQFRFRNKN